MLTRRRQILGDDHPNTLRAMNNLVSVCWDRARTEEAIRVEEVLDICVQPPSPI